MNDPRNDDDEMLEDLFATARDREVELSPGLREKLLRDADIGVLQSRPSKRRPHRPRSFRNWLPAVGGLSAAAVAGVAIGLNLDPDTLLIAGRTPTDDVALSALLAGADPSALFIDEVSR